LVAANLNWLLTFLNLPTEQYFLPTQVWINSNSVTETLLVARAIETSQNMAPQLVKEFVRELVATAQEPRDE
jgi:hypothetical protein